MAAPRNTSGSAQLLVYYDVHHYELSPDDQEKMNVSLDALARQVEHFPLHDLRVLIERNARNNEFSVKLTLLLPGRTLVGSDHDAALHAAFERVLSSLVENVRAYKDSLGQVPERQRQEKGTRQEIMPATPVNTAAVEAAVGEGDYPAFRAALAPYEDPLRLRAGRWVERYPEIQARMGRGLDIGDVVDGVFLAAFEGYNSRPVDERFGEWLETLLDPTVRAIAEHPDEELENINMARSACEAGSARPNA
jgi:ribosome-associated translation inhibitor RaiA